MTKEGIYEYIARQKTAIISSVSEDGYRANPKGCSYKPAYRNCNALEDLIWINT